MVTNLKKRWNEKQAGLYRHSAGVRRGIKTQEEADKYPGLHKDAGHAYSQDVLSFMLGREGKSVYIWKNLKGNKQTENGNNSEKDTKRTHSHSAPVCGLN